MSIRIYRNRLEGSTYYNLYIGMWKWHWLIGLRIVH
jgi:hypothetical protein